MILSLRCSLLVIVGVAIVSILYVDLCHTEASEGVDVYNVHIHTNTID